MKEYKINDKVFIVPIIRKPMINKTQEYFCELSECTEQVLCTECIFWQGNTINKKAFNIWVQNKQSVNNFLQGKQ